LTSGKSPDKNDPRQLFAVIGVLAVPDHLMIQDSHIYTITGTEPRMSRLHRLIDPAFDDGVPKDIYNLELHRVTGYNYHEESVGSGIGQLLSHPIWRV